MNVKKSTTNYLPIEIYKYHLAFKKQIFVNLIVQSYMIHMTNKFIRVYRKSQGKKKFKKYVRSIINLLLISQSPVLGLTTLIFEQKNQKNNILLGGLFMSTNTDLEGNVKCTYHVKRILLGIL